MNNNHSLTIMPLQGRNKNGSPQFSVFCCPQGSLCLDDTCSFIHLLKLVKWASHCFFSSLLTLICPECVKFSKPSFFIKYTKFLGCPFLISMIVSSSFFAFLILKSSSFDTGSVYYSILNICFFSCDEILLHSLPY